MAHRYFAVREIEVRGVEHLDAARVLGWLGWAGMVEGSSIWSVSPRILERALEEQPAIAQADVRRVLLDRIEVAVRERRASALLRYGSHSFLVDRTGTVLGEAPLRDSELPILTLGGTLPGPASATQHDAGDRIGRPPGAGAGTETRHVHAKPSTGGASRPDPRDVAEWLPERGQLRQAVQVAATLESGSAGVSVSEVALHPGRRDAARPELIAYSSDGRLTMRFGWGDWQRKIDSLRRVLDHRAREAEKARAAASRPTPPRGAMQRGHAPGPVRSGQPEAPLPSAALDGTLDLRDPESVVAHWTPAPAAPGAI